MKIFISDQIKEACPQFCAGIIECSVKNSPTSEAFWAEMKHEVAQIKSTYTTEQINKRPSILATRQAYKLFGKDPNRYRPSAEALCRRITRDIDVYKVSTLVDIINLVSIRSGFSIGGFDVQKIQGDLELRVGKATDYFEAIGRGILNVEGLPLYCDNEGGIGTPTSDNERTKISDNTTQLLLIINGYNGKNELDKAVNHTIELLEKYADLSEYSYRLID